MTAEQLFRLLLDMDSCVVDPRPSQFGEAAELVRWLVTEIELNTEIPLTDRLREKYLGDWRSVDLSPIRQHFQGRES